MQSAEVLDIRHNLPASNHGGIKYLHDQIYNISLPSQKKGNFFIREVINVEVFV